MSERIEAYSDSSPLFVEPSTPKLGDTVRIRLRVNRDADVMAVYVRAVLDGIDHFIRAEHSWVDASFAWFEARVALHQPVFHYHFRIHTERETRYFNRSGLSTIYPTEEFDYVIDALHSPPDWVRGAVFYQVFPDRFCNGNPELDVNDGEITRDGFTSRRMDWRDRPLPYSDGGSLDFFNGDLPGLESKLPYLKELGVTALYINPIFRAKTNHRYDCIDYFSVDPHLGGDEALAQLVKHAHEADIKVVIDVSINHIGREHPWAGGLPNADGSLTRVVATDGAGNAVNWMGVPELLKLDYTVKELCDAVFRAPDSLIQKYLKPPFSIDGWRFDVASETGNYRSSQLGHNLWREIRTIVKRINPQAYILGEHWQESFSYVTGDQWDSAMNYFGCARPLRMWLGEADPFNLMQRREAVPGRRITGGELAALLHQHFDRIHTSFASAQFNLIDSHDVVRIHNESELFDWHHYCGAIALLFLLPGATSIYYGDEVGIAGSADGDHGKRFPMPWDPERWDQRYVRLYRELIALKRTEPALQLGGHAALHHEDDVMVFARIYHPRSVVLILNRSASRRELNIPVSLLGATTAEVLALLGQEARSLSVAAGSVTVALDSGRSALLALWNDSPDAFTHD